MTVSHTAPKAFFRTHARPRGHYGRTFTSVPDFAFNNRDILEIHASDRPEEVLARHDPRPEQSRQQSYLGTSECLICTG